jgi:tetratricopeptide (TPR) repeat protein
MNSKQYDKVINILQPMYQQNANDFNLNYNLGAAYQGKGDTKTAKIYLIKAKQINPQMYHQLTGQ